MCKEIIELVKSSNNNNDENNTNIHEDIDILNTKEIRSSIIKYDTDIKNLCKICCGKWINTEMIYCDICMGWYHKECLGLTNEEFVKLSEDKNEYACPFC